MSDSEILDFDAFLSPSTRKAVKIGGESFGVYDLLDLSRAELNFMLSFEVRIEKLSDDEQYAEMKAHILRLVPKMTETQLDDMSLRRLGALFAFVMRAATPEVSAPLAASPSD